MVRAPSVPRLAPLASAALAALLGATAGCNALTAPPEGYSGSAGSAPAAAAAPPKAPAIPGAEGLQSVDQVVGSGREAKAGDTVSVHYTGTLTDGKKFDSSRDRNTPFEFTIGQGRVIKGWDLGVAGMKVGGKRKLTLPSNLGYGDQGSPPNIPPKATLVFDIELLAIR